jgi:ribosomal protein S12 methylthiotransferase accessory factor
VAVVGDGLLATAISAALGVVAVRSPDIEASLLITASDGWDCRAYERIQAWCAEHRMPWLPVRTEVGRTVIGPYHTPGEAGCVSCAELRRSLADERFAVRQAVREKYPRLAEQPSTGLTALTARTVAALTAEEAGRPNLSRCALVYVDLDTLAVSTHRFLPDPRCPGCGSRPDDSPEAARILLRPQPKPAPDSYRVRDADLDRLRETYVSEETGLVRRAQAFPGGGLVVAAAPMRTRWQARAEPSWGRTLRYRTSETVAILEALERFGGMAPGGRRPVVRASFAEVRETAVDPRTFGLYPPERYTEPGFAFQPFDVDRVCRWVWGFSFARAEPVLVPLAYAYYRAHVEHPDDPSFGYEISNGCALGGCLEEAILYGILEVVERDAFLMTWYARLPVPSIDLSSARDRSIPMLAEAIRAETGYRVLTFDTTMEHGIPSVWAMAVPAAGTGGPALACSAGAHLDPEQAASGALRELGPILADLIGRHPDIAERARAMAGDSSSVVAMDDHSVLYTDPAAAARLDFLVPGGQSRSFGADAFQHDDLTDDLTGMLHRLRGHGLDVIVVDQTTPEHRAGGFHCVKVIVPGLLPMTFGHRNRRIHGLPRLFEVPRLLGHRDRALLPAEVNPYPHPFP